MIFLLFVLVTGCVASFQDEYMVVSRSVVNSRIFGYSKDKVCIVTENNGHYYVSLQKVGSFERSNGVKFVPISVVIESCFENSGISYLWTKNKNKTVILSTYGSKQINLEYDIARYDYLNDNIWILKNVTIDVYKFKNIWNRLFKPCRKITLNNTCDDMTVVDGRLFCNYNHVIYTLNGHTLKFYTHSNSKNFTYVLYPYHTNRFTLFSVTVILFGSIGIGVVLKRIFQCVR